MAALSGSIINAFEAAFPNLGSATLRVFSQHFLGFRRDSPGPILEFL